MFIEEVKEDGVDLLQDIKEINFFVVAITDVENYVKINGIKVEIVNYHMNMVLVIIFNVEVQIINVEDFATSNGIVVDLVEDFLVIILPVVLIEVLVSKVSFILVENENVQD